MLYDVEEDRELYLAPKLGEYSAAQGGTSRHLLVNGSRERIAIKFKCSNNELYRISPVYSCIEPGCTQRVHIVRDPGVPKVDKMILLYKRTNCKNARDAFYKFEDFEVKRTLIALVAHDLPQRLKPNSIG